MTSHPLIFRIACVSLLLFCGLAQAQTTFKTDPIIDWPMREDPNLIPPTPPNMIPDALHQMWKNALDKPEQELRIAIMQSICKAHEMGITGLVDIYGMQLKSLAENPKSNQTLAMMAVTTLITLNDTTSAQLLLKFNKTDKTDWIILTDATLAKWKTPEIIDVWLSRASNPQTSWASRYSALQQLAITAPEKAQGTLRQLLGEKSLNPLLKLVAAKALGKIAKHGLVADAQRLAKGDVISRLMAIACLNAHDSDDAVNLVLKMVTDTNEDSAVILAAGNYLLGTRPAQLVAHAQELGQHKDASIRQMAANSLVNQITPQRVPMLAAVLNDANPQTRVMVRDAMINLASKDQLSQPIKTSALSILKSNKWEGQEQAAFVLGKLDVESAVDDLFEVLDQATRKEARLACATAIRWLNIDSSKPTALAHARKLFKNINQDLMSPHANELAQLLQWFGQVQYEPATSHCIEYIPKNIVSSVAREAAIWTIGKIGKNAQTQNLSNKLMSRVKDANEMNPENPDVQLAAIVTLARLGHNAQVTRFLESVNTSMAVMLDLKVVEMCQIWLQAESSDKPFVMPKQEPVVPSGWYLQPNKMPTE